MCVQCTLGFKNASLAALVEFWLALEQSESYVDTLIQEAQQQSREQRPVVNFCSTTGNIDQVSAVLHLETMDARRFTADLATSNGQIT